MVPTRITQSAIGLVAACVMLGAIAAPSPAQSEPPADLQYSPSSVDQGGTLTISGVCGEARTDDDPAVTAHVSARLLPGQPGEPYMIDSEYPVSSDGTFAGQLAIPDAAPAGDWNLSLSCRSLDVIFASDDDGPFTVTGEPAPTATIELHYSPTSVPQGSSLQLSGTCLEGDVALENAEVLASIDPASSLGSDQSADLSRYNARSRLTVAPDGSFAGALDIPTDALLGEWQLWLQCLRGENQVGPDQIIRPAFTVVAGPAITTPTSPPAEPVTVTPTYTG